jgi:hypothetical protein
MSRYTQSYALIISTLYQCLEIRDLIYVIYSKYALSIYYEIFDSLHKLYPNVLKLLECNIHMYNNEVYPYIKYVFLYPTVRYSLEHANTYHTRQLNTLVRRYNFILGDIHTIDSQYQGYAIFHCYAN